MLNKKNKVKKVIFTQKLISRKKPEANNKMKTKIRKTLVKVLTKAILNANLLILERPL
jgi:hypothetical protein